MQAYTQLCPIQGYTTSHGNWRIVRSASSKGKDKGKEIYIAPLL